MSIIEELVEFKPKTKAVSNDINSNFETLRLSNNEHENKINTLNTLFEEYKQNPAKIIDSSTNVLELVGNTNNFKAVGTSTIDTITGKTSGFVFIEFLDTRKLISSNILRLQNNVDRITKNGDIGIYLFENEIIKEVSYFTAKEEYTNSYPTQTILNAPKNKYGKADFIEKIKLTDDIMPIMDSFENETCVISSSSQYDAINYMPWKAFRHHNNDAYGWLTINGVTTGWLKIEFKNITPKVKAFSITSRNSADANTHSPCDFVIEGSNNDTDWTLLGDYKDNLNWVQNEKRYFALTYFESFKYYRITINKNCGNGTFSGFGALELYESINDIMPMVAKLNFSIDKPLLINTGVGTSSIGKLNQLSQINESISIENLLNNSIMYVGFKKNSENKFEPFVTSARPTYSNSLQKYSNKNSIPTMISLTTSKEFKFGYTASCSSFYTPTGASYPCYLAFNGVRNNKWVANVVGGNQWLQIDFPNYRKIARFTIVASHDDPGGSVKKGYIKGFNGEEWIVLKEINEETDWIANEVRHFDADVIEECIQFKLEITEIQNMATRAQVAEFQMHEVADCFVIPENKFYSYNLETQEFEEKEIIYVGRIKTQNNFISDVCSYAVENQYISEDTDLSINTLYSFFHNLGFDYKNLKVSGWIKDKTTGFTMPWYPDSNYDAGIEFNNYGFHIDECQFNVRTPSTLMRFKDCDNIARSYNSNVSLLLQVERIF